MGFIQQVPIYQTPDQGQKRNPSPLFGSNSENNGKRSRHQSGEMSSFAGSSPGAAANELCTIQDIMLELKKLATKEDIVHIKGTLIAQSAEIQQLRGEIEKQGDRIKSLETDAGERAAKEVNRTTRPDVDRTVRNQHGSAQTDRSQEQNRRSNIVIHGLKIDNEDDMMEKVLDMCQAMKAIVFTSDIVDIAWLGRFEPGMVRPPPLRVSFQFQYMRDSILRKKSKLQDIPKFSTVFINPDEPLEVRRIKGVFRRVAIKAREDGKNVSYRADWIQIDDEIYQASEINRIPKKYMAVDTTKPGPNHAKNQVLEASGGGPSNSNDNDQKTGVNSGHKSDPNVKIKLTKCGLTFSGKTAFVSNLSNCDFVYRGQPYTSTEQGLQHQNALHHKMTDIAAKIMNTTDTALIKQISHDIPKSEEWNRISPGILWDLNDCKYSQNPPLMDKLLDTAPHKLVEASFDTRWGGGAPFGDDIYEQEIIPGKNVFGEMATSYRDKKIAQKSLITAQP